MKRNESKDGKRMRFIRPSVSVDQEELQRQRERSVQLVQNAMQEARAKAEGKKSKTMPLRRFGSKIVVAMFHHKRDHEVQRKIVVMEDSIKWGPGPTQFQGWAEVCMGLPGAGLSQNPGLTFQYFNEYGTAIRIDDRFKMQAWLDECWCRHPLELHAFEVDTLLREAQERDDIVRDIFDQYDRDGSGALSALEVQEMLLNLELAEDLGISREDLVNYVVSEFRSADVDDDGKVEFEEFVKYYNGMQDFIKTKLTRENRHNYVHLKFREECIEARSRPTPLRELRTVLNGILSPILPESSALTDSKYTDSAAALKYDVHLTVADDSFVSKFGDTRIVIKTLLSEKVESFVDCTGLMGELCSPVVEVQIEDNAEIGEDFTVRLPHCFAEGTAKEDIILCYGHRDTHTWNEVEPSHYQLVVGNELLGTRPSLIVTMYEEGIVAAFSRNDRKLTQRVRACTFLPKKIIPLETELLHIYLVPDLPNELQELQHREEHDRGLVYMGGSSEVIYLKVGSGVHITVEQQEPETHACLWEGSAVLMEYEFDPEDFMKAIQVRKSQQGENGGAQTPTEGGDVRGELGVKIVTEELHVKRKKAKNEYTFGIAVHFHAFPSPSAPLALAVKSRTATNLWVAWSPPVRWGGCCLDQYELQIKEKTMKTEKDWATVYEGANHLTNIGMSIWACTLRVRVYNVGSTTPSEWSKEFYLGSEKEEEACTNVQRIAKGNRARKAGKESKARGSVTENEGGLAVVEQTDLSSMVRTKHVMRGKSGKSMVGWSRFKRKVGEFFMLIGVHGGATGKLFDLSPDQVEAMVLANSSDDLGDGIGMSSEVGSALISLGYCAVWVIETLAHHTENATEWIEFMNEVGGLVEMAATLKMDVDEAREGIMRGILFSLFEIYETLRQCEEGGFITMQLRHNYGKKAREDMRAEWQARLSALRNDVACGVMSLVLHHRKVQKEKAMAAKEREEKAALEEKKRKFRSSKKLVSQRLEVGAVAHLMPMQNVDGGLDEEGGEAEPEAEAN